MKKYILIYIAILYASASFAQPAVLKAKIEELLKGKKAIVGISVQYQGQTAIALNAQRHLPMQSVYKFPIALAVLCEIEKGRFKLEDQIKISPSQLLPDTWSPIRDKYPKGTQISLAELIRFTVAESDNNGCDILLGLIGGPQKVERFLKSHGLEDIAVKTSEEEAHKDWSIQYQNWATAAALNKLLIHAFASGKGRMLSEENYRFIWKVMEQTSTGPKRIKGELPAGTWVAHKTGTSGVKQTLTAATNDIGVVMLPSGKPLFISILVSDSQESAQTNEQLIASISKLAYDHYAVLP